ncbi:MAG TPA: redoxin domain-containing protein [Chitinophagaceae bacterium]
MKYLLIIISFVLVSDIYSQSDTIQPPFKKIPIFPPVKLMLPGNTTFTKDDLPKKKPVMLMVFSPMCEHCKKETEELIKNIDRFGKSEIVMATMMPYDSMMSFREKYELAQYENIIVGQDTQFFLPSFYMITNLPFLAFYDKKGKLISFFEGSMPIEKAAAELQKQAKSDKD